MDGTSFVTCCFSLANKMICSLSCCLNFLLQGQLKPPGASPALIWDAHFLPLLPTSVPSKMTAAPLCCIGGHRLLGQGGDTE